MAATRRRPALTTAVLAALALSLAAAGCSGDDTGSLGGAPDGAPNGGPQGEVRLLGDGSTSLTGRQPLQPTPRKLRPGQKPPQFVVFSWDGAGEDEKRLFSRFRKAGKKYGAAQTYFLSGIYTLPEDKAKRYAPPGRAPGASDIGFLRDKNVRATLKQVRKAWLEGSEIGTHFNGHFCGPGGVDSWSVRQWKSEIRQARWFVEHWKTTTGWREAEALPFDYSRELVGGRTPCLEGQENLLKAARQMGFRYDSSGNGTQVWPGKRHGLWDLPLQQVPVPGRQFETLSMDYNFLANQSGTVDGAVEKRPVWEAQMRDGLLQGFERAYHGNRAPMIIGNHFEDWNGGIYMDAVEDVMKTVCPKKGVRCVSFRQLVDWLDAQDPRVLAQLRTLEIGERPEGGWRSFLAREARGTKDAKNVEHTGER
ncbi:hypothetical protein FM076_18800 [Streptomyces albus subsp. chlorinus]|uniref:hypothetical protein n=1 Tax=Streptomyces albus TaxID=1888 RepID=UPI0015703545|nr:hypothetical protein [Streptomyces albus]NSC23093.1 hypothetical protein [Streptomyces albus subsp. chlorinus]